MRRTPSFLLVLALLLVASPATGATAGTGTTCGPHWVTAWGAAPTDGLVSQPPLEQTFRIQVRPTVAGDALRVRVSNRFGTGPVTFGAATVGRQATGAAVVPGSIASVTFGGAARVRVARGADVVSDPVRMRVVAGQPLLVSLYVVGVNGPATQHVLSGQTTWQSLPLSGDRTRATSATGFLGLPLPGLTPAVPQAIPYLSGVDVVAAGDVGTVVAFGDSITDGFQGTLVPFTPLASDVDQWSGYPDALAGRLRAAGLGLGVVNAGISGNELLADGALPIFGRSGLSRLDADALDLPGVTTLLLMEGVNDIGKSRATAAELISGYLTAVDRAHARGIRVLLGTLTPTRGYLQPGYGTPGEPTRQAVNAWIRTQRVSDGIFDADAAVRDPARPDRLLPTYDGGDHAHLSPAGYRALAASVPLDLLARPGCSS